MSHAHRKLLRRLAGHRRRHPRQSVTIIGPIPIHESWLPFLNRQHMAWLGMRDWPVEFHGVPLRVVDAVLNANMQETP